jgi:PilZ domain-containing protein
MTGVGADKRDSERFPLLSELHGEVTTVQPITIKEISRDGVQIETRFPLYLDSLHEFRLTLGERSIVLKGRVVHCAIVEVDQDAVVYQSGIEFIEPSGHVSSAVDGFIAQIRAFRRH